MNGETIFREICLTTWRGTMRKNLFITIIYFLWFLNLGALNILADTTTASATGSAQEIKRIVATCGNKHAIITFNDETGKQIKQLEFNGSISYWYGTGTDMYYLYPGMSQEIFVLAYRHFVDATKQEYYETAQTQIPHHRIVVYDNRGNVLFDKNDVSYLPVEVSRNGERIVCYEDAPDLTQLTDFNEKLFKNPPKDKLVVLSRNGDIIFSVEEKGILTPGSDIRISPSGNWLLYQLENNNLDSKIWNITEKKMLKTSGGKFLGKLLSANDDGSITVLEFKGREQNGSKYLKSVFRPENGALEQVGVEYKK